jgi:hypothetical protein
LVTRTTFVFNQYVAEYEQFLTCPTCSTFFQVVFVFHGLLKLLSIFDILVVICGALTYGFPNIWPEFEEKALPMIRYNKSGYVLLKTKCPFFIINSLIYEDFPSKLRAEIKAITR